MNIRFLSKVGLILLLFIISCDSGTQYDYFIINKCNEKIDVLIVVRLNQEPMIKIEANSKQLVYIEEGLGHVFDSNIELIFQKITITKGNYTSKINYVNKDVWEFEPTSKHHANCYLTVYPEDFENE